MFTVAFDGLSGAGKTTCTRIVIPRIVARGYRVLSVNEKELEPIRSWVIAWHERAEVDKAFSRADVISFAHCRAAAHQQLRNFPGDILHFDRSIWTSAVYQRSADCSASEVLETNRRLGVIFPETTFLFLAEPTICHERVLDRVQQKTDYKLPAQVESLEQIEFTEVGYKEMLGQIPELHIVDGNRKPETVAQDVEGILISYLG